jgi:hypothetical protein
MILFSNNRPKLAETINKLGKETYLLPGKKKAREMLLFILEKLDRGYMIAEGALSK